MKAEDYDKYPLTFGPSNGIPFSTVKASNAYDMITITLSLPFDAPNSITYFALNGATKSSGIVYLVIYTFHY